MLGDARKVASAFPMGAVGGGGEGVRDCGLMSVERWKAEVGDALEGEGQIESRWMLPTEVVRRPLEVELSEGSKETA